MTDLKINRKRIIVVGRNYCNILVISRALGEAGYDVDILRLYRNKPTILRPMTMMKPEKHSRYVKQFRECVVGNDKNKAVAELSDMKDAESRVMVIAVDDYSVDIIDSNLNKLKEYFILPGIKEEEGAVAALMDKNELKKKAGEYGLPVLNSCMIQSEKGNFNIPDTVVYPCFIKPNVSQNSTKAKMKKCDSREELEKVLKAYAEKEDFQMLVEDFVNIKHEYSILGYSIGDEVKSPGIFRVLDGGHQERKGVAITGRTVNPVLYEEIIKKCNEFIRTLNYTGLFDVDLLETESGELYFIELNFRAGASVHVFTRTGVNIPAVFADRILCGSDEKISDAYEKDNIFISEKILMEEYIKGDTDKTMAGKLADKADVTFIKDERDPEPYKCFKRFYAVAGLMRLAYRIKRR